MSVPTPASQEQRLTATGWSAAAAADMAAVYYGGSSSSIHSNGSAIPGVAAGCSAPAGPAAAAAAGWLRPQWQAERVRTERLELMDELEEWRLMQVTCCGLAACLPCCLVGCLAGCVVACLLAVCQMPVSRVALPASAAMVVILSRASPC